MDSNTPDQTPVPSAGDDAKAKSKSVALLPTLWAEVDAIVDAEYGGNRSAFFRELVEAKFAEKDPSRGLGPLVDFAQRNHPGLAGQIYRLVQDIEGPRFSQHKIAARMVEMLLDLLRVQEKAEMGIVREEDHAAASRRREKELEAAFDMVNSNAVSAALLDKVLPPTDRAGYIETVRQPGPGTLRPGRHAQPKVHKKN